MPSEANSNAAIGARLQEQRLALQITVTQAAEVCGVTRATITNWEKGEPTPPAAALAKLSEKGLQILYVITGAQSAQAEPTDAGIIVGKRIQEERDRLKLKLQPWATACDFSRTDAVKWDAGLAAPDAISLAKMATFGMDVLYIITGQRESKSKSAPAPTTAAELKVGDRLRIEREKHFPNQSELADAIGIVRKTISMWERDEGSPNAEALTKMGTLGMDVMFILTGHIATPALSQEEREIADAMRETTPEGRAAIRALTAILPKQK